jgi:uncharacterized protein YlzI (FlbEa/FlbD family)
MAMLVIVHKTDTGEETILNCHQIAHAWSVETPRGNHTTVKMSNGDSFSVTESLYELIALAR